VRVVHPFHPRFGEEFEFLARWSSWRGDVVLVLDGEGCRCSFPVEWTDVMPVDPFTAVSEGRCPFRTQDLVQLAGLVGSLRERGFGGVAGLAP
jgi:hypothetical protein